MKGGLAIIVLVLAGCGGAASRGDFVSEAIKICKQAEKRITALGAPELFTETQLYARRAKDAVGDEIADLRDLDPPPELDNSFAEYLSTLEQRRRQLDILAAAADANSMPAIQQAGSDMDVITAKARTQARAAGIADCESG